MKSSTLFGSHKILLKADASTEGNGNKDQQQKSAEDGKKPEEKKEEKIEDDVSELSPEELKKRQKELKDMTRGRRGAKADEKKDEKKEEKPAATDDKKEEKKEDKAAPTKNPAPAKNAAPAKRAVDAPRVELPPPISDVQEPEKKTDTELKTDLPLRPADKRKLRVIQQMESDGTTPKGTAEKTLKFWELEAGYKQKWEDAHPGQDFDEDADEHKNFYEKNEVTYDAESYELSRDNLVRNEARNETEGRQNEEKKVQNRVQEFHAAQKNIAQDSQGAVMEMISEAAPELAALMGEGKDRALTQEITEKMLEKDPVVTEILQETAEELAVLTVELHRLTQFDDVYPANIAKPLVLKVSGRRIYPHADLLHFMNGLEEEMLKMDPQQTMRGKQRLVPNTAFNKEHSRILNDGSLDAKAKRAAVDTLNSNYYTLTEDDFRRGLIAQYAATAKSDIEKFTKRLGHRTPKTETAASSTTPAGEKKDEKKDDKKEEETKDEEVSRGTRTRSPSSASASDVVDTGNKATNTPVSDAKSAVARTRGR